MSALAALLASLALAVISAATGLSVENSSRGGEEAMPQRVDQAQAAAGEDQA